MEYFLRLVMILKKDRRLEKLHAKLQDYMRSSQAKIMATSEALAVQVDNL
jgi:hypothetical protein